MTTGRKDTGGVCYERELNGGGSIVVGLAIMRERNEPSRLEWWHVIWTTFLAWPATDRRGDWQELADFYTDLAAAQHTMIETSAPLPTQWQRKAEPEGTTSLSPQARELTTRSLLELAASDRVAGNTPIAALAVQARATHLLLACPAGDLHQRVGRLKSRSATLLSFDRTAGAGGKGTWGRGFWWARLRTEQLVDAVRSFIVGLS
jgi:hypothetical protein